MTPEQIAQTAASIASMQEPDGAIPWTIGEHTDAWNHVEGAMALLVGGEVEAAEAAYDWCLRNQREDGSWAMKLVAGTVEDASTETNMAAYIAVGVLHHWSIRHDREFLERMWPVVRRALDLVVDLQLPFGGIAWSREWDANGPAKINREALLAGSSSIYQALRCGVALAEIMDEPQPEWELAGGRLGHALREHRDQFLDKSTFSMDWYYPVLGGAVRGAAADEMLASRWDTFVEDGLGIRCVSENPWFTGRRDLRARHGAAGDRRSACRAGVHRHAAPAQRRRCLLDRLRHARRRPLAARAHDLHRRGRDPRVGRAHVDDLRLGHHDRPRHRRRFDEIALECDCPSRDELAGVTR